MIGDPEIDDRTDDPNPSDADAGRCLEDPRSIHPAPEDVFEEGAEPSPPPVDPENDTGATPPDEELAIDDESGQGMVDPRSGIAGPDL